MKRFFQSLFLIVFVIFFSGKIFAQQTEFQANQPVIKFDKESVHLGKVKEGMILYRKFKVQNAGGGDLNILETKSTCGCTVPKVKKSKLAAGESTTLRVMVDTSMKQDEVTKTLDVLSDDPVRPKVVLSLSMNVENRHKNLDGSKKAKILTDEHCMSCHVYKGVGAFGKDLYDADCAMCHGITGEGASGPSLLLGGYQNPELVKVRREVIACGSKKNNSMPGFEYTCGGPLSSEQVDSLIAYLKSLSESKK